ncbi:hypothetical protein PG984_010343 [Apiospora sp. TS-2023a]
MIETGCSQQKIEFNWRDLGLTGSGPTGIPPVVTLLVGLGLGMFLGAWFRRVLLSSQWGRRAAGAVRLFTDEEMAAASRNLRLLPLAQV